jgi:hypothetical protein
MKKKGLSQTLTIFEAVKVVPGHFVNLTIGQPPKKKPCSTISLRVALLGFFNTMSLNFANFLSQKS